MSAPPRAASRQVRWPWALFLLGVVCLPRATIDIYLPSLPAIGRDLKASIYDIQLTMTVYMVGYALSVLVCGPLADRFGRRSVLFAGLSLYAVSSLACTFATAPWTLIAGRFLQALGGCCGTVVGRVIVRDRFPPITQVAMLSMLSTGMALSPVVAPLIGGIVEVNLGWRWTFGLLAAISVALMLALREIPETRPATARVVGLTDLASLYAELLRTRSFLRYAVAVSLAYCTYFPFVMESSNILQRGMGMSPLSFAIAYGTTILGYVIGTAIFRKRSGIEGTDRLITWAIRLSIVCAVAMKIWTNCSPTSAVGLLVPMGMLMLAVGVIIPACQFAVLQPYAHVAGAASGLFFFIQLSITAGCSWILAQLSDGTSAPMVSVTLWASLLTAGAWHLLRTPLALPLDRA